MSLGSSYFDALYARHDDPWRLDERWYERRKRALTLAMLPRERFGAALEIGCSIGSLTAELAPRCDRLLAVDIAEQPLRAARARLAAAPHVGFARMNTPDEWPPGHFDLIMLSEVGYYLDEDALRLMLARIDRSLEPDGVVVACHWRHPVPDYPLRGDRVHDIIRATSGLRLVSSYRDDDFRLELFSRQLAGSVASEEGLVSSP